MVWINFLLAILLSYLLGSLPTAYLAGRILGKIDIRTVGSGNVGATNVLRVLGKGPGFLVLLIDALKGIAAVAVIAVLFHGQGGPVSLSLLKVFCFLAVVGGHIWPVFLGFHGGKGVATSAGGFLALYPAATLMSLVVFLAVVSLTRYVSLASILAVLVLPVSLVLLHAPREVTIVGVIGAVLVVFRHRTNIVRLLHGDEKKLGEKVVIDE